MSAPASGNIVAGNYIGTNKDGTGKLPNFGFGVAIFGASDNIIGGTTGITNGGPCTGACNLISGNSSSGVVIQEVNQDLAQRNVVLGNFIGTSVNGKASLGNGGNGVILLAAESTIGGNTAGAGNVISANSRGILIGGNDSIVQGNFIGTDVTGTIALSNAGPGIRIDSSSNNVIGGTVPGARNVISGNGAEGVDISSGGGGNVVQGNFIGTNAAGSGPLGNASDGIYIGDAAQNALGGTSAGAANTIAYNGNAGVYVQMRPGNAILSNSIFSNSGLGIDLSPNGVTANDADDSDVGPNLLQNYPVLVFASLSNSNVNLGGTLKSKANTAYRIEFFGNEASDPSGFDEGQVFLASANVTTDGNGNASFNAILTYSSGLQTFSATATDPNGDTSEFSKSIQVAGAPSQLLNISHTNACSHRE